jgi:hypothetical protein
MGADALAANEHGQVFVRAAVTIVVKAIADLLCSPLEGIADLGLAIDTGSYRVGAKALATANVQLILVGDSVTVVIGAVANLRARALKRITGYRVPVSA